MRSNAGAEPSSPPRDSTRSIGVVFRLDRATTMSMDCRSTRLSVKMISRPAVPRRYLVGPSSRHRDDHEQTPLTAPNRRPLAYNSGRKSNHINLFSRAVIWCTKIPLGTPLARIVAAHPAIDTTGNGTGDVP